MNQAYPLPGYDPPLTRLSLPRGWIDGLVLSNDAGDATNDLHIAPGVCRSTANTVNDGLSTATKDQRDLEITDALVKQLDVVWAPGNGGMRHQTAIANTTYHIFAMGGPGRTDDIWADTSLTPTLPGGFTAYYRIGSIVRIGAAIRAFTYEPGGYFRITTPLLDVDSAAVNGTTITTLALASIPLGLRLTVLLNVMTNDGSSAVVYIHNPNDGDVAASITVAPLGTGAAAGSTTGTQIRVVTNTLSQISFRAVAAITIDAVRAVSLGWWDYRGLDS